MIARIALLLSLAMAVSGEAQTQDTDSTKDNYVSPPACDLCRKEVRGEPAENQDEWQDYCSSCDKFTTQGCGICTSGSAQTSDDPKMQTYCSLCENSEGTKLKAGHQLIIDTNKHLASNSDAPAKYVSPCVLCFRDDVQGAAAGSLNNGDFSGFCKEQIAKYVTADKCPAVSASTVQALLEQLSAEAQPSSFDVLPYVVFGCVLAIVAATIHGLFRHPRGELAQPFALGDDA